MASCRNQLLQLSKSSKNGISRNTNKLIISSNSNNTPDQNKWRNERDYNAKDLNKNYFPTFSTRNSEKNNTLTRRTLTKKFNILSNYYQLFSKSKTFSKTFSANWNCSSLFHTSNTQSSKKTYDYVIVGAGSAGCVLANRLSADKKTTVSLLEAGPTDDDNIIQMPLNLPLAMSIEKFNWNYLSKPQSQLNNRVIYAPRGRVLGGSSSINGVIYMRGHPYDYDRWEAEEAEGWSYASCLPYFKKAENYELGKSKYRGGDGPLYVTRNKVNQVLHETWIKAGIQAGYSHTDDFNGYKQEGFGHFDTNVHKGVRWSSSKAYLEPAMKNSNLHVTTNSLATKILFDGKKAVGVQFLNKDGKLENIMINKEVILSGGAINSPQLLLLSGLGDESELKRHSINIIANIPGIGKNLQDHTAVHMQYYCKKPITLFSLQSPEFREQVYKEWDENKSGWGTTVHLTSGGFIRSEAKVLHPDIQFHFIPTLLSDHGRKEPPAHSYEAIVSQMRSQSKGSVSLQSNDPRVHPIFDPNYCSLERDFWELKTGIKLAREILFQSAFDEFRGEEFSPGKDVQTDKQMDQFLKCFCEHIYHPTSTCKMGSTKDNSTVVDSQCRVVGVDNLRVIDASVMPSIVSGNTNAPTMMIAEKVSDMILGKTPLEKLNDVPVWKPKHPNNQRESDC